MESYVKILIDSWPLKGRTGSLNPYPQVFRAEPSDDVEMVKFIAVDGMLRVENARVLRFGFAPALGLFLEYDRGGTYTLMLNETELVTLKRRLYEKWGLKWNPEEVKNRIEEIQGIKLHALSRLNAAIEDVKVPKIFGGMEIHGDHIVYVVRST